MFRELESWIFLLAFQSLRYASVLPNMGFSVIIAVH